MIKSRPTPPPPKEVDFEFDLACGDQDDQPADPNEDVLRRTTRGVIVDVNYIETEF